MYQEEEFIPLSAIQHYIFCPRQCSLIHLDEVWRDNILTIKGTKLHERVDSGGDEKRGKVKSIRALRIHSFRYGLAGKADLIEFYENGKIIPVEYKRGLPKKNNSDKAQLCAQALCLEEMIGANIHYGKVYYGKLRKRIRVKIDTALREETIATIEKIHTMLKSEKALSAKFSKKCRRCSLMEVCMPKAFSSRKNKIYIKELFEK